MPFLTADELAASLQIHPRTVMRWARRGLPFVRVGAGSRLIRFDADVVREWLIGRQTLPVHASQPGRRRPGRPRKVQQMAR